MTKINSLIIPDLHDSEDKKAFIKIIHCEKN